ncbi:MAG: thioredoxin domain-containing protein [Limnochordia bacterium]|jgi:uncharacterized protein YyaL (SSP411 family)
MPQTTVQRKQNRLVHESSPYLQQHASNPVDWYPWGADALEKAKREQKLVFLSIGYSACHWCHVMRRESFENEEIANHLNEHFVSIKVDREERPDLDFVYQNAAQLLGGHGGWPLSVFLTPDLYPFYAGTYYPPHDRYGYPGFLRVLESVQTAFASQPEALIERATQTVAGLTLTEPTTLADTAVPNRRTVVRAVQTVARHVDLEFGGFGDHPKFPHAQALELLLRQHGSEAGRRYVDMGLLSLQRMAQGGLYDHLGGGFHRYSTDRKWLIPHFEKMLYDNALMPPLYLSAFQITGQESFATVARETLDYVLQEMTHPQGAFFSTQDADSDGEEGKFYVWRLDELQKILGRDNAEVVATFYGVTEQGNFNGGTNVLHQAYDLEDLARRMGRDVSELQQQLQSSRARLYEARRERSAPHRDEKVLTGWNGLMISAMSQAAGILNEPRFLDRAEQALSFVWEHLRLRDGRLLRSWTNGPGQTAAFLEDYVFLSQALLDVYQLNFRQDYLDRAQEMMALAIDLFWDDAQGGFFLATASPDLIHRPKSAHDLSLPSANAMAANVLLRLHAYLGETDCMQRAERMLALFGSDLQHDPWGTAGLVGILDNYAAGPLEVVVVCPAGCAKNHTEAMLRAAWAAYHPHRVIYAVNEEMEVKPNICEGKTAHQGFVTAYVCHGFSCSPPIVAPETLRTELETAWQPAIR